MNNFKSILFIGIIFLIPLQLSYAGYDDFTVNVPNAQGGYTAIIIKKSGDGYVGPQGEYYSEFPKVSQLQTIYGINTPNLTIQNSSNNTTPLTTEEKSVVNNLFNPSSECTSAKSYFDNKVNLSDAFDNVEQGTLDMCNNDFTQAILDFNKAIGISPKTGLAYQGRATAFYFQGDYGQAIGNFTQAIGLPAFEKDISGNPIASDELSDSVIYQKRGIVYYAEGEYTLAIDDFNKAIQMMPSYMYCIYFRGRAYDHLGNHDLAINNYEQAVSIERQMNETTIQNNITLNNPKGSDDGITTDIEKMVNSL